MVKQVEVPAPSKIDLVTQKPNGTVVLVMVEERSWVDSSDRLAELQAKVNLYLAFALDGHLVRSYPDAAGKRFELRLDCAEPPDEVTSAFIDRINGALANFATCLTVQVIRAH